MTPTSDERREMAARLRDEAGGFRRLEKEWGHEPTIDLGDVTAVFQDVAHFAGLDGTVRTCVLLDRLADLIEPPEITEDTSDGYPFCASATEIMRLRDVLESYAKTFDGWAAENNGGGRQMDGPDWLELANELRMESDGI